MYKVLLDRFLVYIKIICMNFVTSAPILVTQSFLLKLQIFDTLKGIRSDIQNVQKGNSIICP